MVDIQSKIVYTKIELRDLGSFINTETQSQKGT